MTAPEHKGKGYAREVLAEAEDLLRNVYKTPAVTLGTAADTRGLPKCTKDLALKNINEHNYLGRYIQRYSLRKHCSYQNSLHSSKSFWNESRNKKSRIKGCDSFLYPVSIYNYFVTTLRSTGILASTASPLITFCAVSIAILPIWSGC